MNFISIKIKKQPTILKIIGFLLIGTLAACNKETSLKWPGYIEGQYLYISSVAAGALKTLPVQVGEEVRSNQILYTLDPNPEQNELLTTQEQHKQAKSSERQLQEWHALQRSIYDHKKNLYQKNSISKEAFDAAQNHYQQENSLLYSAKSNTLTLKTQLDKMQWLLQQKTVKSPVNAFIYNIFYQVGENVPAHTPVLALLAPDHIKAIFYLPASSLGKLKLNQAIYLQTEDTGPLLEAKISYISPHVEFTPPMLYSKEVSDKLTYRVEAVPIKTTDALALHPGQPITVSLKK